MHRRGSPHARILTVACAVVVVLALTLTLTGLVIGVCLEVRGLIRLDETGRQGHLSGR
ncbi:hypothetical protein QF036_002070 [Arthrobacter globiformis]|nr:hypothetical protein [Arthrobacter globiformis]